LQAAAINQSGLAGSGYWTADSGLRNGQIEMTAIAIIASASLGVRGGGATHPGCSAAKGHFPLD